MKQKEWQPIVGKLAKESTDNFRGLVSYGTHLYRKGKINGLIQGMLIGSFTTLATLSYIGKKKQIQESEIEQTEQQDGV